MNVFDGLMLTLNNKEWNPSFIPQLKNWLVSDNPSNNVMSDILMMIKDKSGTGTDASAFNLSAGNGALMLPNALNGRSVFQSNSTHEGIFRLNVTGGIGQNVGGITMAIIQKKDELTANAYKVLYRINKASPYGARAELSMGELGSDVYVAGGRRIDSNSYQGIGTNLSYGTSDWNIIIAVFDYIAATITLSVNGTRKSSAFQTTGIASNTVPIDIGINWSGEASSTNKTKGQMAELLIANSALSTDNLTKLEGYLAHQWGLQGSLPTGHAYKTIAPRI